MKVINNQKIRGILAENVQKYRKSLNYSQEKLAEKAELSVQTIKNIECGRSWVSDTTISVISKSLNIPEYQLFLPDRILKERKIKKPPFKTLLSLKSEIKAFLDNKFEDAINTGDFS